MMRVLIFKLILIFFVTIPVFSQSVLNQQDASRERNLNEMEPFWRQALGGAILSIPSVQVQSAVIALDGGNIRA